MSSMKVAWTVLLGTILFASWVLGADCAGVQNAAASQLIAYLKSSAINAEPECVTVAIRRLGDLRDASGTSALISALDFARPKSVKEEAGLSDLHDRYPAVPALFSIGPNAAPALVNAI